ncbi:GNAT family N-acetyltransferase [Nocardioides sp. NBC_00368]|uniref:GNAT family N-acetyltransferase n=1 Tax=Nocardioides sp. NBC_00368 TaxID=2976000 RepID=UPI002E217F0D
MPRTDTMRLRPLSPGDEHVYAAWAEDEEFRVANGWPERDRDGHLRHWRRLIEAPPPELIRLAVEVDEEVVGYADLHGLAPDTRELGIAIGPSSRWGQGLGQRAIKTALTYGFSVLDLTRIWAETHETNARAKKLFDATGFIETGRHGTDTYRGEDVSLVQYAVERPY